jgi:hypothetical protein
VRLPLAFAIAPLACWRFPIWCGSWRCDFVIRARALSAYGRQAARRLRGEVGRGQARTEADSGAGFDTVEFELRRRRHAEQPDSLIHIIQLSNTIPIHHHLLHVPIRGSQQPMVEKKRAQFRNVAPTRTMSRLLIFSIVVALFLSDGTIVHTTSTPSDAHRPTSLLCASECVRGSQEEAQRVLAVVQRV